MASIRKVGGKYRAEVCVGRKRRSRRFAGHSQARDWSLRIEQQLRDGADGRASQARTVGDALERYERDVTPRKKGARWESVRLKALLRDRKLAELKIAALTTADLAAWRDRRLQTVSGSSVSREMNLIGAVLTRARKEWGWMSGRPMTDVARPKEPPPRERRVTQGEIERLKLATGYRADAPPRAVSARVGAAFLFAIETAMRCGEICGLAWDDIDVEARVATLADTKNGWKRTVPLSRQALRILEQLRAVRGDEAAVFGLDAENASALFRKSRIAAEIDDLTFHDSRHEAITRLASKMDVLALARMVGHRDIRMLQVYYNRSASDIARDL